MKKFSNHLQRRKAANRINSWYKPVLLSVPFKYNKLDKIITACLSDIEAKAPTFTQYTREVAIQGSTELRTFARIDNYIYQSKDITLIIK